MMKTALVLALIVLAPIALAASATEDVYAFPAQSNGSIFVEVHYADGLASTKFTFLQLSGAAGGPGQRLKPTPECTEWIGRFDEAALKLGSSEHVRASTVRILGAASATGNGRYENASLSIEAAGGPGSLSGSLLICDRAGDGLARFTLAPAGVQGLPALPVVVRVSLEATP